MSEFSSVEELAQRVADGLADESVIAELEELMRADPSARVTYLRVMQLHQDLERKAARGTLGVGSSMELGLDDDAPIDLPITRSRRINPILVAAAALVLAVGSGLWITGWRSGDTPTAIITRLDQVGEPLAYLQPVEPGDRIDINAGLLELTYRNGVRLVLQGPADFTLEDAGRGRLERGALAAEVPRKASGFTVVTPTAEVTDIGTRFGVALLETGRTEFEVFDGEIEARSTMAESTVKSFKTGEAAAVDDGELEVQSISADSVRFRGVNDALNQRTVEAVADCFVQGGEHADRVSIEENLLIKQLGANNEVARKVWIRFDLADEPVDPTRPATLTVHTAKDIKPASWDIQIHGLLRGFTPANGRLGVDWRESKMTWNNAPGNESDSPVSMNSTGTLITSGRIRVDPETEPAGSYFTFTLPSLEPYLQSDGTVTLMVSTLSRRHEVLTLAAREHGSFAGPLLAFEMLKRNEK